MWPRGMSMLETAIGIIGGAIVAIVITITVEMQRRPKLRMRIGAADTVTYLAVSRGKRRICTRPGERAAARCH